MKRFGTPACGMSGGASVNPGALGVGTPPGARTTPRPPGATTAGRRGRRGRRPPPRRPPPRAPPPPRGGRAPERLPPPEPDGACDSAPPPDGLVGFGLVVTPEPEEPPEEPDPPPELEPPPPDGEGEGDGEDCGTGTDGIFGGVTLGAVGSVTVGILTGTEGTWRPKVGTETVTARTAPPPRAHAEMTIRRVALMRRFWRRGSSSLCTPHSSLPRGEVPGGAGS